MASAAPRFRLLGALTIEGVKRSLGGPKQQAMLAYLLLNAERAVSTSELVDAVWGDEPPATADAIVHGYVRRIRALLAWTEAAIRTDPLGYRLELGSDDLDTSRYESLLEHGMAFLREGRPSDAAGFLRQARDLWRGEPLHGLPETVFVLRTRTRLESARSAAALALLEARLESGEDRDLVPELEAMADNSPYDESVTRLLMLALARSGAQAAALSAYREQRRRLVEDLGLEPSAGLQELEAAVLRQDGSLLSPPRPTAATVKRRHGPRTFAIGLRMRPGRSVLILGAVLAVVVILIAFVESAPSGLPVAGIRSSPSLGPSRSTASQHPSSTVLPTGLAAIVAAWRIPQPSCCGVSGTTAWGAGHHDASLREIDLATNQMSEFNAVTGYQSGIPELLAGSVWIPSARGPLVRFDPATDETTARITMRSTSVAFGYLDVWATTMDHHLDRVSVQSNSIVASIPVASGPNDWADGLAIGAQAVWDSVGDTGVLVKVDPSSNTVLDRIEGFGDTYSGAPIAFDSDAVWLLRAVGPQMTLFRIDARTDRIAARIAVGSAGGGNTGTVAAAGGRVWTVTWDGALSEVDEATNRVVAAVALPQAPQNISYGAGALWVDSYDASLVWRLDPARIPSRASPSPSGH